MTRQEILEKAIRKAVEQGWLPYFAGFDKHMSAKAIRYIIHEDSSDVRFEVVTKGRVYGVSGYTMEIPSIIFNHDFAKALWGEEPWGDIDSSPSELSGDYDVWQARLMGMVIADDPIAYLGENI